MIRADIRSENHDRSRVVLFSINNVVVDLGSLDMEGLEQLRFDLLDAVDFVNRALCVPHNNPVD